MPWFWGGYADPPCSLRCFIKDFPLALPQDGLFFLSFSWTVPRLFLPSLAPHPYWGGAVFLLSLMTPDCLGVAQGCGWALLMLLEQMGWRFDTKSTSTPEVLRQEQAGRLGFFLR